MTSTSCVTVALPSGASGDRLGTVQGRRHDLPELRNAAVLRADRRARSPRSPASCCSGSASKRSFAADLGRRAAVDQRHGHPPGVRFQRGADRDRVRPTNSSSARRSTRSCASSRSRASPTARARAGSVASSCAVVTTTGVERVAAVGCRLTAGQDGAVRRRSQLGPDHPGRRSGDAGGRLRSRWTSRSRAPRSARRASWLATTRPRWPARRSPGDEVELEIGLPGEGAEAEMYFSDLGHEYVTLNAEYTT